MRVQNIRDAPVHQRTYGELQLLCGTRQGLMDTEKADLKVLHIRSGSQTSHHFHIERESVFHVVSGELLVRSAKAGSQVELRRGDTVIVDPGEDHVLQNMGRDEAVVLEVESPPHAGSDKIPFGSAREDVEIGERQAGRFWHDDGKVKVKICGVESLDAAMECARLGVDAIGIHAVGQRAIEKALRHSVWLSVVPSDISVFLLTDSSDCGILSELIPRTHCDTVQIQGAKSPSEWVAIAHRVRGYGRRVVCTVSARCGTTWDELSASTRDAQAIADAVLFDAGHYGGTGQKHDWRLTEALREEIHVPVIAAGGLNCTNCVECIHRLRPYGIDVESGVEMRFPLADGGRLTAKDFDAISKLIVAAKGTSG